MNDTKPEMMITLRDNARHELLKIQSVEEGITYLNKLKSIDVWVKAEKKDAELQNIVAEQKLRTQRILGELIQENQRKGQLANKGESRYNSLITDGNKRTLEEVGISPRQSMTFQAIASIPEQEFENFIQEKKQAVNDAVNELTTSGAVRLAKNVHVSNNSGEIEWYTPEPILIKAKAVLGEIDLDPASSEDANRNVGAKVFYTEKDNGLDKEWFGNVWLNPPYGQPIISLFSQAVLDKRSQYKQLLLLVNNATETQWLQSVLAVSDAVCLLKSRIKYIDRSGNASGTPLQGQVIIYIGSEIKTFTKQFSELGVCMVRCDR